MDENKIEQEYVTYFGNCDEIKSIAQCVCQTIIKKQSIIITRIAKAKKDNTKTQVDVSNLVLSIVKNQLKKNGFVMESKDILKLYLKGIPKGETKIYYPDGIHKRTKTVLEIEAGRSVSNYNVLKDYIECISVDTFEYKKSAIDFVPKYLILVVPAKYRYGNKKHQDAFTKSEQIFKPLFEKGNNVITGICLIGYLLPNN